MIKAFNDVKRASLPQKDPSLSILDNLSSLQVGHGNTTMKTSSQGLWLGSKTPASAPFSVRS